MKNSANIAISSDNWWQVVIMITVKMICWPITEGTDSQASRAEGLGLSRPNCKVTTCSRAVTNWQSAWTSWIEGCMTCWDWGVALLTGFKQFTSKHPKIQHSALPVPLFPCLFTYFLMCLSFKTWCCHGPMTVLIQCFNSWFWHWQMLQDLHLSETQFLHKKNICPISLPEMHSWNC